MPQHEDFYVNFPRHIISSIVHLLNVKKKLPVFYYILFAVGFRE